MSRALLGYLENDFENLFINNFLKIDDDNSIDDYMFKVNASGQLELKKGETLIATLSLTTVNFSNLNVGTLDSLNISGNLTVNSNTLFVDSATNAIGIGTTAPKNIGSFIDTVLGVQCPTTCRTTYVESITNNELTFGIHPNSVDSGAGFLFTTNDFNIGNVINGPALRIDSGGDIDFYNNNLLNINNLTGTNLTATNLNGTIITPIQTNITKVGNLDYLIIDGNLTFNGDSKIISSPGTNFTMSIDKELIFKTNSIERMRIEENGYIGIGTTTPTNLLHLETTNTTNLPTFHLANKQNNTNANVCILLRTNGALGGDSSIDFDISGVGGWKVGVDNSDFDKFKITRGVPALFGTYDFLTIDITGNVGINQPSPIYDLDIIGDVNFTGDLYKNGVIFNNDFWDLNNNNISNNNTGNVGIGITDPTEKLEVNGNTSIIGDLTVSGNINGNIAIDTKCFCRFETSTLLAVEGNTISWEITDYMDNITLNVNEDTFTVPSSGIYHITYEIVYTSATRPSSGDVFSEIQLSNGLRVGKSTTRASSGGDTLVNGCAIVKLNTNDTIKLYTHDDCNISLFIGYDSGSKGSNISITKISN